MPRAPTEPTYWHYSRETYDGRELQRNPGIPDNRMHAYGLPSRVGKWLHYPDGRKEPFPTKEPAHG